MTRSSRLSTFHRIDRALQTSDEPGVVELLVVRARQHPDHDDAHREEVAALDDLLASMSDVQRRGYMALEEAQARCREIWTEVTFDVAHEMGVRHGVERSGVYGSVDAQVHVVVGELSASLAGHALSDVDRRVTLALLLVCELFGGPSGETA